MIPKQRMVAELAEILAGRDEAEYQRLYRHHMGRTSQQVRESLLRQRAISQVTLAEIALHCQVYTLAGTRRAS